jgi:hypothetical protein
MGSHPHTPSLLWLRKAKLYKLLVKSRWNQFALVIHESTYFEKYKGSSLFVFLDGKETEKTKETEQAEKSGISSEEA